MQQYTEHLNILMPSARSLDPYYKPIWGALSVQMFWRQFAIGVLCSYPLAQVQMLYQAVCIVCTTCLREAFKPNINITYTALPCKSRYYIHLTCMPASSEI